MRIKRVTALAYLHQLEDQKIRKTSHVRTVLWKAKVEQNIKTTEQLKKFSSSKNLKTNFNRFIQT